MSTATDLGTFGFTLVGYGVPSGSALPGPTVAGLATYGSKRIDRDADFHPVYQMTGFDTVALTEITWISYNDPQQTPPPSANPVINVSATRIG